MKKLSFKMPKIPLPLDKVTGFLNSRSTREKHMFIGFFIVFLLAVDYMLIISPALATFTAIGPQMSELQKKREDLIEDRKNSAEIKKKWEQIHQMLAEEEKAVIAPAATAALLESLSKEARETGVKITSVKPVEMPRAKKTALFSALPIKISAIAGTHELGRFLARLETGGTFFRIMDLSVTSSPLNERRHVIELSLEAVQKEPDVAASKGA